jgi:hypothetical protein
MHLIKIQRIIILPVVSYGCEKWSVTFREECRLRVFGSSVLRRIRRPKWDKVTGEWRRLHNEEPYDLFSPNIIRVIKYRRIRWAGHVARTEGQDRYIHVLLGRPEVKRLFVRPRPRWEDNMEMDLQEVRWGAWTGLIWIG